MKSHHVSTSAGRLLALTAILFGFGTQSIAQSGDGASTTILATLEVDHHELGIPFHFELIADSLADNLGETFRLVGTSSGTAVEPINATVTFNHLERAIALDAKSTAPSTFSIRRGSQQLATVTVQSGADGKDKLIVRRGGTHILTATTKSIDWSMARKDAPSLVTVLAMLVDDGSANANATGGENILMVSCSPTYAECLAGARAACHPMKAQAVYSCSSAGDVLCSWTCASVGPGVQ